MKLQGDFVYRPRTAQLQRDYSDGPRWTQYQESLHQCGIASGRDFMADPFAPTT